MWRCWVFFLSVLFFLSVAAVQICEDPVTHDLSAHATNSCPADQVRFYGAGVNLFDALWAGSSGQVQPGVSYNDTLQGLESLSSSNIRYFRFFASLWGPNMIFWVTNEKQYWQEFDRLMTDIDRLGLYCIPSIGYSSWYEVANLAVKDLNETANDMVLNSNSTSQKLALKYFDQFTRRYVNYKNILLFELGNELNLISNLPPPHCGTSQCFDTDQMVAFTEKLVSVVRRNDKISQRPISSGFSVPRPSAWHMEHCPMSGRCEADPGSGFWSKDTVQQFKEILLWQNHATEIISIHVYEKEVGTAKASLASVTNAVEAASSVSKALYVGEYGGPNPNFTGPLKTDQEFPLSVLTAQVGAAKASGAFMLSTIWAWACPTHRRDMVCIYPNSTVSREAGSNRMLSLLQHANAEMKM